MIQIREANNLSDYILIVKLAKTIWTHHYVPIIGEKQVEYMLEKIQSVDAITKQVEEGYCYFVIRYYSDAAGYICIKKDLNSLFLSKIYVLSNFRGKKIGKAAMNFVAEKAKELNCDRISLTVNKGNNNTILAYNKMGFEVVGEIVIDIGNGFVMDDFKMEKPLML